MGLECNPEIEISSPKRQAKPTFALIPRAGAQFNHE
jgi:hypothetical protein